MRTKKLFTFLVATLAAQVTQAADCQYPNIRWNQGCDKDGEPVTDPMAYITVSLAALACCACCYKPILGGFAALFKECQKMYSGTATVNEGNEKLLPV